MRDIGCYLHTVLCSNITQYYRYILLASSVFHKISDGYMQRVYKYIIPAGQLSAGTYIYLALHYLSYHTLGGAERTFVVSSAAAAPPPPPPQSLSHYYYRFLCVGSKPVNSATAAFGESTRRIYRSRYTG